MKNHEGDKNHGKKSSRNINADQQSSIRLWHRMFFQKCIVGKPPAVFCNKFLIIRILADVAVFVSFAEKLVTAFVDFFIIYLIRLLSPVNFLAVFLIKNSFFHKCIQINKIWITCKCRERLIWRISIAGRSQWQNLPVSLSGFL